MYYTTLNRICNYGPCTEGWYKLLKYLGKTKADDEPLSLRTILESNGLDDAIWALRAIDDCPEIRLFAIRCVREIQHLFNDPQNLHALDVAELYAIGEATEEELKEAGEAAWHKARAVWDVWYIWDVLNIIWDTRIPVADAVYEVIRNLIWEVAEGEEKRMIEIHICDFIDIFCQE